MGIKKDIEDTQSESITSNIVKEDDHTFAIYFTYKNEGTPDKNKYSPYYGTNYLKLIPDKNKNKLEGFYYTNRIPQTKGKISLKYQNNNLNHEF